MRKESKENGKDGGRERGRRNGMGMKSASLPARFLGLQEKGTGDSKRKISQCSLCFS